MFICLFKKFIYIVLITKHCDLNDLFKKWKFNVYQDGNKKCAPKSVVAGWRADRIRQEEARMEQSRAPFARLECQQWGFPEGTSSPSVCRSSGRLSQHSVICPPVMSSACHCHSSQSCHPRVTVRPEKQVWDHQSLLSLLLQGNGSVGAHLSWIVAGIIFL